MQNYLTPKQAIAELSQNSTIPDSLTQLANLATYGELSPVVRYNGLLSIGDSDPVAAICFINSGQLIDLIDDRNGQIKLETAVIYDGIKTGLEHGQVVTLHTKKTYHQWDILIPESEVTKLCFEYSEQGQDEIANLHARIAELESELSQTKAGEAKPLPVIDEYTTPAMQAMSAVINEFWANYTPDKIPPKQNSVIDWIMENYEFSRNLSLAIEQVARPESAKTGGNKAI